MAQNDFHFLTLAEQSDEQRSDTSLLLSPLASNLLTCGVEDDYVPVNFISEEVLAMIKGWQLGYQKRQELKEASVATSMEIEPASFTAAANHDEPMRCIPNAAPPKRFYRTFWKGVTRRMVERQKAAIFEK